MKSEISTIFTIITLILISCSSRKPIYNYFHLNTNVKKLEISYFEFEDDVNADLQSITILERDTSGKLINRTFIGKDGTKKSSTEYKYDRRGNMIESRRMNAEGETLSTSTRKYNRKGKVISRKNISSHLKGRTSITKLKYNKSGRLVEDFQHYSDGEFRSHCTYSYNSKGQSLGFKCYKEDGSISSHFEKIYNDKGKQVSSENYSPKGILRGFTKNRFNDKGDIILTENYSVKNGETKLTHTNKTEYKYDSEGEMIESLHFRNNIPETMSRFKTTYWKK